MIIQIRGTSGSGKSTAVLKLMKLLGPWEPKYRTGRKKPLYYINKQGVVILGHYEIACGGCDTIGSAMQVYHVIKDILKYKQCKHIISEGLLWGEDRKWTQILINEDHVDVRALFLTTTNDVCLQRILKRRADKEKAAKKPAKSLNLQKHVVRARFIELTRIKLQNLGVNCRRCSDDQVVPLVMRLVGATPKPKGAKSDG